MWAENQTGMEGRHIYYEYLLPFTLLWYYIFSFRFPYIETKRFHMNLKQYSRLNKIPNVFNNYHN